MNKLQMQIYYYKQKLGLTNEDLSKKTGLSKETISRLCKGTTKDPKSETLRVIAKAFNVTVDELIGTDENVQPYFLDQQTAEIAQDLAERPELSAALRAMRDLSSEDIKNITGIVEKMKK